MGGGAAHLEVTDLHGQWLAVGLEDPQDLIDDLDQALRAVGL